MEVKLGYKQTEVGVIPEDWDVALLANEIDRLEAGGWRLDAGVSVNSDNENSVNDGYGYEPSVLKTSAVMNGRFLPSEAKKIIPSDVNRAKLSPVRDSIIISRMNTPDLIGECGYVAKNHPYLFLPDRLWMTHTKSGSDICIRWLSYVLSSQPYKARITGLATGTSGSMKNIAKNALLAISIPYPKSEEQRTIATALSDMDTLLDGLDRLIAKKRVIKQATMQQLLTGQTRLPGFSGEWEMKFLGELCWFQEGPGVRNTQFTASGMKLLNGTNIFRDNLNLDTTTRFISMSQAQGPYAHFLADEGDIVLASSGITIERLHEKVAIVRAKDLPFCMNTSTIRFKVHPQSMTSQFLFQFLKSDNFKNAIGGKATGSAQLNFGPSHVAKVLVNSPLLPEQTEIATILSDMDAEITALEAHRNKAYALKQAMMQELLTGRTRLI